MIDRFKTFLAGSPYRMNGDQIADWTNLVTVTLPSVLEKWYGPDFGNDVWAKDKTYYENARMRLVGDSAFKKNCAERRNVLQGLKYLVEFLADEKRKAGLGKTARKKVEKKGGGVEGIGHAGCVTLPAVEVLEEGAIKDLHVAKHERNPALRKACIEHYRSLNDGRIACEACGMAFGEVYGEFGEGYVEVHHLSPISQTEDVHAVDPKTDLVPLCANCHAMIHRLMAAEKKSAGVDLEGKAALAKLRSRIEGQQHRA